MVAVGGMGFWVGWWVRVWGGMVPTITCMLGHFVITQPFPQKGFVTKSKLLMRTRLGGDGCPRQGVLDKVSY